MFRLNLSEKALTALQEQGYIRVAHPQNNMPELAKGMAVLGLFERPQNAARPIWLTIEQKIYHRPFQQLQNTSEKIDGEKGQTLFFHGVSKTTEPDEMMALLWLTRARGKT